MMPPRTIACTLGLLLSFGLLGLACHEEPVDCANGTCVCAAGQTCDIECAAPPCHVDCEPDSDCNSQCANGSCTCRESATCAFSCLAPPCHVICEGDHPHCDGACANGECTCGPDSRCDFVCDAPPCHANCGAGSSCSLLCPDGLNGNCSLDTCDGGAMTCPNGTTAVCGVPCPE